ncbi:Gnk2-like domain containing protein [Parasponia andersonii]|uniref:Gnk2-like domain containing protein n=1 Tax=Parasponia andersonii TaxID=3476 RepID=A0A2P5A6E4_PARAD|nr:Gnk2-like domain containing protein [Parasponia andersonii]
MLLPAIFNAAETSSPPSAENASYEKQAVIWYGVCWIWHQDHPASEWSMGIWPYDWLLHSQNVTETDRFNELLSSEINTVADRAQNSGSGEKFATNEEKLTSALTLYTLAQCTSDISAADCNTCFRTAIAFFPECCVGR